MSKQRVITLKECKKAAEILAFSMGLDTNSVIYGIPRGGIVPALLLAAACGGQVTESKQDANVIVDDLIDSGSTMDAIYASLFRPEGYKLGALFGKYRDTQGASWGCGVVVDENEWLIFPWEVGKTDTSKDDIVLRMLQAIGEDPLRPGLLETPKRVVKAWGEWFSGYQADIPAMFKTFEDGAENVDEMVILTNIPVYSHCEHHMAPFQGVAHVGYIPNGKIVGLSKIVRVVNAFSRRLQVQERITNQIADAMMKNLSPLGVAVVIVASHSCMSSRGACTHGVDTTTSAMRGVLLEKPEARAEFFSLIKK